jgi:hypothetical protein
MIRIEKAGTGGTNRNTIHISMSIVPKADPSSALLLYHSLTHSIFKDLLPATFSAVVCGFFTNNSSRNSRVVGYYVPPLLVLANHYFQHNIPHVGIVKKILDRAKYTMLPLTKQCAPHKKKRQSTDLPPLSYVGICTFAQNITT